MSMEQTREVYMMLHVTKQFELIADIIDTHFITDQVADMGHGPNWLEAK